MYRIAEDMNLIKDARRLCSACMKDLEYLLKADYDISSQISLVGSAKRKLITINGKNHSFDFDYNLKVYNGMSYDPFDLKEITHEVFRTVLTNHSINNVKIDYSTSSLTSNQIRLWNHYNAPFRIDLAIITEQNGHIHRLIHNKERNEMFWNQAADISALKRKEARLRKKHWQEVADTYIEIKNHYINDKDNHPSFKCYIEAINKVFYKYYRK